MGYHENGDSGINQTVCRNKRVSAEQLLKEDIVDNWYIIHTKENQEDTIIDRIQSKISNTRYNAIWIANRYEIREKEGKEYVQKTKLYPGYVFINTEYIDEIEEFLSYNPECKGLLKTGRAYSHIEGANRILVGLLAKEAGQIGLSKGIIIDRQTKVESGPLVGMEEYICKIDRHKRKAWLDFGDGKRVIFPLEITKKISSDSTGCASTE